MYYVPWCPVCAKPEAEDEKVFNFLKCMYHLEAVGYVGIKQRMWEHCCEINAMKSNDSYMKLWLNAHDDDPDEESILSEDMRTIREVFGIEKDYAIFWVSW